ncbi:hypothetical protein [Streptomyces sp. NBC_01420]|uniref:hypothetical protein n=1 Tax=Streptomyces sp. NBC_01420 TaxID=2903858 RepID=UPI00386B27E4
MSMTGTHGPADPHEAAATLLEALDPGVTMLDTGDIDAVVPRHRGPGSPIRRLRHHPDRPMKREAP